MTLRATRALPPKSVLSIAIASLLLGSGAQAATIIVDSNADDDGAGCTLREAIASINLGSNQGGCIADESLDALGTNDTILFDALLTGPITLNDNQLAITKSVRIQGPGAANLAVDGAGGSRVFDISGPDVAVSIDGLTIRNGRVSIGSADGSRGGGIRVGDSASLVLSNSAVTGNSAFLSGGGIYAFDNTSLTLIHSTVEGNSAFSGGGISATNNTAVMLVDSTISGNSAGDGGGGISASNTPVTLTNSTVSNNSAGTSGGGISASNAPVTLTNSTVSNNSADSSGGGILASSSSLTLTKSTVSGNSLGQLGSGGGISASNAPVMLTNSTVSENSVGLLGSGGGIAASNAPVTLINSTVSGNLAASDGGGIRASASLVTLTHSTVSGNFAGTRGGGIYASNDSSMTLTNSRVSGNSAGNSGGGIRASSSSVTLTHSTVSGNSVGQLGSGGGISASNATVTLTNSTISGNSAGLFGGGIYASNTTVMLANTTVSENSARFIGGGIHVSNNASVMLTNSTISGNSAGLFGGGIYASTNISLILTHVTVWGNSAASNGGGIDARGNTSVTLTNTLLAGNSTSSGSNTDCLSSSPPATGNFNLIGDAGSACGLSDENDDNIIGEDPLIGPLADNGCLTPAGNPNGPQELYGCVQTHALLPSSPALNSADPAVCADSDTVNGLDQRGAVRPAGTCDRGAFELGQPAQPIDVTATPGPGQATISWTPPSHTGNGPLLSCTVTAEPDGASCSAPAGTNQCTISGLSPEQEYSFTVTCTNDQEIPSFASAPSDPMTPDPDPDPDPEPEPEPKPVPAVSALGLLAGTGLLGLLGAWRLRLQTRGRIR